ncbi:hypothetical protein MKZ38_010338 [Zalerion maritima]|uniref:Uncharacterized protein n=1 Tax=Zalerion maritima TaxID=339359 RepID=A0AAD5RY51_9PEZI|nr:hypothetical protein MKZ38_010338 [Zalerion maritima]
MPTIRRRQRSAVPEDGSTAPPNPSRSTRATRSASRQQQTPPEEPREPQSPARRTEVVVEKEDSEDDEEDAATKSPGRHVAIVQSPKPTNSGAPGTALPLTLPVPPVLHFPLVAVGSLCIMSMGYSVVREYTGSAAEYVSVTRPLATWGEVALLASWRIFELALGWYGNFDSYDLAALAALSHGPTLYLLHAFYGISLSTTISSLFVEILSTFVPFRLLRSVSDPHSVHPSESLAAPNKAVISDHLIQLLTTGLAAGIYGVTILAAFSTYLPTCLVLYFKNIPSIEAAHVLSVAPLVPVMVLFGLASRVYIFTPSAAQGVTEADAKADKFDPVQANLKETLRWNLWGWHTSTKVGIKRTAVAALMSGVHTTLQLVYGIKGIEATGAAAYAAVWVVAAVVTGFGLGAVGSEG